MEQLVFLGNPEYGCELRPIDFAKFAEACGGGGISVERPGDLRPALERAVASGRPALVEVLVDPNEPPLPGNITMKRALRFAEALARGEKDRWEIIKTVAEDKVREVI